MIRQSFIKYQAAGNDFILIDDRAVTFPQEMVPRLCHRHLGIGADGILLAQPSKIADIRMRIFNSDGSEAENCGNGLRCFFLFLVELGFSRKNLSIEVGSRVVHASEIQNKIKIHMGAVFANASLQIDNQEVYSINPGVPHAVLFVPDVKAVDLLKEGAYFRSHPRFLPQGTNVNFAALQADNSLCVRTFERGVEGETQGCGTGAVAVAVAAHLKFYLSSPIRTFSSGGEMEVQFHRHENFLFDTWLIGSAEKIFNGFFCFG